MIIDTWKQIGDLAAEILAGLAVSPEGNVYSFEAAYIRRERMRDAQFAAIEAHSAHPLVQVGATPRGNTDVITGCRGLMHVGNPAQSSRLSLIAEIDGIGGAVHRAVGIEDVVEFGHAGTEGRGWPSLRPVTLISSGVGWPSASLSARIGVTRHLEAVLNAEEVIQPLRTPIAGE